MGYPDTSAFTSTPQTSSKKGDIPTSTLESVGLKRPVINELIHGINTGFYPNRHSLLIVKDDKLVLEEYFPGHDQSWGTDLGIVQQNENTLHDMRSISKSIVSACVGVAISQGKIRHVNQAVFDFFEDYWQFNNAGRNELTIRHLLNMTSGLKWNEAVPYDNPDNSEIQMIYSSDGIGFILSRELIAKPGTFWQYNGGTTELLAEIIKRVSGKNIHEFAKEFVFKPLGIELSEWAISPSTNSPSAASGLRLTARDMLKFGLLYQNEGRWREQQVIPKKWIQDSLQSSFDLDFGGYGYQFWNLNFNFKGRQLKIPAAFGNGDQRIFFDKKNKLLVATTAGNYNNWTIKNDATAVLKKVYDSFDLRH